MDLAVLRDDMVDSLEHPSKDVLQSEAISVAMRTVPRHVFVDTESAGMAYEDRAFDYRGTRVLAPSTVARLLEALDPTRNDRVLIVGAGVGYTAALLAEIVGAEHVNAIDLSRRLVWDARYNLEETGYEQVLVDCRDGADGMPEYAPFDRILVEAAAVRPPHALCEQLAGEGHLVMPLGVQSQTLVVHDGTDPVERFGPVRFKPLLVEGEQAGTVERNRTAREDREFAERHAQSRRGWEQDWIDWGHEW